MYEKFGQFINGRWQKSENNETYEVLNPATEEIIGNASKAGRKDVEKALSSAEKGFKIWRNTTPWQRSYVLRKVADKIREKKDILSKWMTLEVGKPLAEGVGEADGAADIFEWNAEETKRIYGQTVESRFPETRVHVYYQPVGVVAALVPWNFPLILASRKISTALAAGCSVICKPDVITPGTVMELIDICRECGVPEGVVNLLSGDPASISEQLIESDIVKKFIEKAKKLKIGNGLDEGVQLGPLTTAKRLGEIEQLVEITKKEGAKVLLGGKRPSEFNKGYFYEPTVFDDVQDNFTIMRQEPFGPLVPMLSFKTFDEVIERANNNDLGLCSYIYTNDMQKAHVASELMETGCVAVNTPTVAVAEAPFGGIKQTGYGREGGSMAIKDYLNIKYTHLGLKI